MRAFGGIRGLFVVSMVLLAVRLWAATLVGFGDSEALYACWAAHPQPAYLDHPGLVGIVARVIGDGAVPLPARAHVVTSFVATLVPWLLFLAARAGGAKKEDAANGALVLAVVPEIAVGLFALTPDLLLAPLWLGALALAALGLRPARDWRSPAALLGAGLLAGTAASAKVSGLLLLASLAVTYAWVARSKNAASGVARSIWPWAGIAAGLVVVMPVFSWESQMGFPMLAHRFVATQHGAGLALRNLGALLGGQLAYLSPVLAWLAVVVGRDLVRRRSADVVSRLLFVSFALPVAPLLVLCLWSPVAEPHWLAPPLLALPIHAARRAGDAVGSGLVSSRLARIGALVAAAMTALAHAWVLVPGAGRLLPASIDMKADITSELYGWPSAISAVKEQMLIGATPLDPEGREVVVVGPHWTVCAQLEAALPGVRVGCATPIPDDFDRWFPRDHWRTADTVLFVTDNRYPTDGASLLPSLAPVAHTKVRVLRASRTTRLFDLYLYTHRPAATR